MNHYDVTIRETLEVKMKVAANSREEAEQFARDQWKRGEVVLDASHFTGVEFHAKRYPVTGASDEFFFRLSRIPRRGMECSCTSKHRLCDTTKAAC